jgi:D-glycero-D-manno-heptose 1,7-bisphosphate phosphatase
MKLIILDRDGVINRDSDAYIKAPEEWEAIPGSLKAIACLNEAGYRVIVATNQSGIGRGLFDIEALHRIHEKMRCELAAAGGNVDAIVFCPHRPEDGCACRKPKPGLLLDIASRLQVSLAGVPAIGDSLRDLQAARAVGALPILVKTGKGRRTLDRHPDLGDVPVYEDLAEAAAALLAAD